MGTLQVLGRESTLSIWRRLSQVMVFFAMEGAKKKTKVAGGRGGMQG
jgi:hypothetical protein